MKITKAQLKQIIKEELSKMVETAEDEDPAIMELLGQLEIVVGKGDSRGVLELMSQLAAFDTDGGVLKDALGIIQRDWKVDMAVDQGPQMSNREDI
jgi:hypothetical protein